MPKRLWPLSRTAQGSHCSSTSRKQIDRLERIDRETVSRILTQPEIAQLMQQYRSWLLMMVPKVAAATKLLEGLQYSRGLASNRPQQNRSAHARSDDGYDVGEQRAVWDPLAAGISV